MTSGQGRIGRVKFYDPSKDFGFVEEITEPGRKDVYFNRKAIELSLPIEDELVFFDSETARESESRRATEVHLLTEAPRDNTALREIAESIPNEEARSEVLEVIHSGPSVTQAGPIDRLWMVGKVKFFDSDKGYGFTRPLRKRDVGGEDVFVHQSRVLPRRLNDGDWVAFRPIPSESEDGSVEAAYAHRLENFSGNPSVVRELLAEDAVAPGETVPHLHNIALNVLGAEELQKYAELVLSKIEGKSAPLSHDYVSALGRRLENAADDKKEKESLTGFVRERVGQIAEKNRFSSEGRTILFTEGLAPLPSPEILAETSGGYLKEIAKEVSEPELRKYADETFNLVLSGDRPPSENRRHFEYLHRLLENACVDDTAVRELEDQLQEVVSAGLDQGALRLLDVAGLWRREALDNIRPEVLAEALENVDSEDITSYLKRLDIHKLAQVAEKRTESLIAEDQGHGRLDGITSWIRSLQSLEQIGHDSSQKSQPDQKEPSEGFDEREAPLRVTVSALREECTAWELTHLYARGLVDDFPSSWVKRNLDDLSRSVTGNILNRETTSVELRTGILRTVIENLTEDEETAGAQWAAEQIQSHLTGKKKENVLEHLARSLKPEAQSCLYARGLLDDLPSSWVKENLDDLPESVVEDILCRESTSAALRAGILRMSIEKISEDEEIVDARWTARQIQNHLAGKKQRSVSEHLARSIGPEVHLEIWRDEMIDVLPEQALDQHFEDASKEDITRAATWSQDGILPESELAERLDRYLKGIPDCVDPDVYPPIKEAVRQLGLLGEDPEDSLEDCAPAVHDMAKLALWNEGNADPPDPKTIQNVFVALVPEEQVRALRWLFHLHAKGKVSLDIKTLSQLSRVGPESLSGRRLRTDQLIAALTPEIAIKTLQKIDVEGQVLLEGELLKILLQSANRREEELALQGLFSKCNGRTEMKFAAGRTSYSNQNSSGPEEKKIIEKEAGGVSYFEVQFRYDENLIDAVKQLPHSGYHSRSKTWMVKASPKGKQAVKEFAKAHNFFIELQDGHHYSNNPHLHEKRTQRYKPCKYCEGRHVDGKHWKWDQEFWWCRGEECFEANRPNHSPDEWESYTLKDFIRLLQLDRSMDDGAYGRYMGTLNRFNELLERLGCRKCEKYMHPVDDSAFAHYRVTRFHCTNEGCTNRGKEVYLHHCLNSKCSSIIDSRDSKQCPNGWWICTEEDCGACCSTEAMEDRRDRLHRSNQRPSDWLKRFIERKKGHVERAEHFCYSCGSRMVWLSGAKGESRPVFRCEKCEIEYDTEKAGFSYEYAEQLRSDDDPDRLRKAKSQH